MTTAGALLSVTKMSARKRLHLSLDAHVRQRWYSSFSRFSSRQRDWAFAKTTRIWRDNSAHLSAQKWRTTKFPAPSRQDRRMTKLSNAASAH